MKRVLVAAGFVAVAFAGTANAQALRAVSMLTGNETTVLRPHLLNDDCTAGQLPDVRVVSAPQNGSIRMEKTTTKINVPGNAPRARCNGKEIDAVGVVYKSNDGFVGVERITLKADFHNGTVSEMVVVIDVR